jgi:hypothetical protein
MFRREGVLRYGSLRCHCNKYYFGEKRTADLLRKLISPEFLEYLFLHPFAEVAQLVRAQDS